ncbi:hypothetical protein Tco_0182044, partial [Tanacetum coccineum]
MVGTRSALLNTSGGNADHPNGLDEQTKEFIKQRSLIQPWQNPTVLCDSTVQKYHERFELLLNKVELPEVHAISLFLGGMPQSISLPVRMFKPKSLSDTASLCKLQEATLAAHKARQSPILPKPSTGN